MARHHKRRDNRNRIRGRQQCKHCHRLRAKGIFIPYKVNFLLLLVVILWQLLSTDLVANMATVIAVIQQWTSSMS